MRSFQLRSGAFVCALCLVAFMPPADAKPRVRQAAKSSGQANVKLTTPKVRYANGDSEAQRRRREEARLRRECQGRPNAGACLGRTR